jgi:plasmid stabilization system protein ParE
MKAVLTEAGLTDLMEIARHIGRDDIPTARRFTAALRKRAHAIGCNPRLYPLAEGFEAAAVRRRLYRGYLILYVERESRVEVLHIVHAARDWSQLIEQDLSR